MPDDDKTPESKLDAFLDSWDKKPDEGNKEILARMSKLEEDNKALRETQNAHDKVLEAEAYKEDIKPAIATIGGETKASNRTVHEWLNGEADDNPKLRDAWNDREKNPEAFDKMIEALKPKFKEHIEAESKKVLDIKDPPEGETTETEEEKANRATSHAARIARNTNAVATDDYEKVDWPSLNDNEFAQMSEKVFADMRSGKLKPEAAA